MSRLFSNIHTSTQAIDMEELTGLGFDESAREICVSYRFNMEDLVPVETKITYSEIVSEKGQGSYISLTEEQKEAIIKLLNYENVY